MTQQEQNHTQTKKNRTKLWFWVPFILFLLLIIFLLLATISAPFQTRLIKAFLNSTNANIEEQISIKDVSFHPVKGAVVNDLLILDYHQDTLLYASKCYSGLTDNLLTLWNRKLSLSDVRLEQANITIKTEYGNSESNLDVFLSNFSTQKVDDSNSDKSRQPITLDVNSIFGEAINLKVIDENKGSVLSGGLASVSIAVDNLNLEELEVKVSTVRIDAPKFSRVVSETAGGQVISSSEPNPTKASTKDTTSLKLSIADFELTSGEFSNMDDTAPKLDHTFKQINYSDIDVSNIAIRFKDFDTDLAETFSFDDFVLSGDITADNKSYEMSCPQVFLNSEEASVQELSIKTGNTTTTQSLELSYDDFSDFQRFKDDVFMNVSFNNSRVDFADVVYFLPNLSSTPLIRKNYNRIMSVDGVIKGRVNNFSSKTMTIKIGEEIDFAGSVRVKDITDPGKTFLSINVDKLNTSVQQLKSVIPLFNPPDNFYKLQDIKFDGSFSGFIYDFVAKGTLESVLGTAILDTRLDLKLGREQALYSGQVDLIDFNLRTWTDNPQFGYLSAKSEVKNGKGLLLNYLYADLEASISQFDFREYSYSNINLNGQFDENQFVGDFSIEDDNIDFKFDGKLNIDDGLITTDLRAYADKLDLKQLNLSKEELILQGSFDLSLSGSELADINGFADVDNLTMFYKGQVYDFDSIYVKSDLESNGNRNFKMRSSLVDVDILGKFNPENIPYHFTKSFRDSHPLWWESSGMSMPAKQVNTNEDFDFIISVEDSKFFAEFVDLKCLEVKNLLATGEVNTTKDLWYLDSQIGSLNCDGLAFYDVDYSLSYLNGMGKTRLFIDNWKSNERRFKALTLDGNINKDSLSLNLNTSDLIDSVGQIAFTLEGIPVDSMIQLHIESEVWQMLGQDWTFSKDNKVLLSKDAIEVADFVFTDGNRVINVTDIERQGVKCTLEAFDLALMNDHINYPNIYFSGKGTISALIDNVFKPEKAWVETVIPHLYCNDEDYGKVYINAATKDYENIEGIITIKRQSDDQRITGNYTLNAKTQEFNGLLEVDNLNLSLFEYIIAEGTSGTKGTLDLVATIDGKLNDFRLEGEAMLYNGQSRIDYIGNVINFHEQKLRVTNSLVDLTGVTLTDMYGNSAIITGGLKHTMLKNFAADASIRSERFVGLNTTKADNPTYYGFAMGELLVGFDGPFSAIDIDVEATTGETTVLNIPVENSASGYEESFITFIEKEELIKSLTDTIRVEGNQLLSGANVEMNITITPDAEINIIFDEKLNDRIKGRGRGDIQVISTRTGDFNIYGNYEIEQGEYLFTAWGFVAKPFVVERGGLITWSGDPFNANLNIEAYYDGVRAPLFTFIQEYLVEGTELYDNAKSYRTDVQLKMLLQGTLYNPSVGFDFNFPDLNADFQSFVGTKLNALRQNEAELNDQVAALLIFQSFIPSNNALGSSFLNGNNLVYSGINTLSEFLSSQISFQLSSLLEQALVENGFLSSIDFELALANNSSIAQGQFLSQGIIPSEVEVHLKPRFNNDRWGLDIGTGYVRQNQLFNAPEYYRNDFVVEYYITKDKRFKLRVYSKSDYDLVAGGGIERELRYGAGITYRKEFGSLMEVKEELNKEIQKAKKKAERNDRLQ